MRSDIRTWHVRAWRSSCVTAAPLAVQQTWTWGKIMNCCAGSLLLQSLLAGPSQAPGARKPPGGPGASFPPCRQPTRPGLARITRPTAEHVLVLDSWGYRMHQSGGPAAKGAAGAHSAEIAGKEAAAPWWGIPVAAAVRPPLFPRPGCPPRASQVTESNKANGTEGTCTPISKWGPCPA